VTVKARVYRYELPLLSPLPRHTARFASGFIIEIETDKGKRYGEVADAALCGAETPVVIEEQLRVAVHNDCQFQVSDCAPVKWAMSSALCDEPFPNLNLPLNALLDASRTEMVDDGLSRHAEGFRCFKIKIGDAPPHDEIARIFELSKVLGRGITFRLDGNRKLTLATAVEYAKALKKINIEYFEEPFADLEDMAAFFELTGRKIALDETVIEREFERWHKNQAVCAYVLKPSRIGAKSELDAIVQLAGKNDRMVVLSSTFESGIGLIALAKAAACAQNPPFGMGVSQGLATGSYFAADLVSPPLRPFRGQMMVGALQERLHHVDLKESKFCQRILA